MWRDFCLRGTGFPIALLDGLVAIAGDRAIEQLFEIEGKLDSLRSRARDLCISRSAACRDEERRRWRRVRRCIDKLKVPADIPDDSELRTIIASLSRAFIDLEEVKKSVSIALSCDIRRGDEALRELASNNRVREAVIWQNRQAVKTGFDQLLRKPAGARDSKTREYALLVASYVQRYCTKSETIGFFGPMVWGRLTAGTKIIEMESGPDLAACARVCFEY